MITFFGKPQLGYYAGVPSFSDVVQYSPPYLKVGRYDVYPNGDKYLSKISLKDNRRGGDTGKINFSKQVFPIEIGDEVKLYISNKLVWSGYVEKKTLKTDLECAVIADWGKLQNIIVSGSIVIEVYDSIYNIVLSLENFIQKANIGFSHRFIQLPHDIYITTTIQGRNIAEILDECEENLPAGYTWQVKNGIFKFMPTDEEVKTSVSWHNNDFSESKFEEEFSDIYTESAVFMKVTDPDGESYEKSLGIVGDRPPYPPIQLKEYLGVKMNKVSYPFELNEEDALQLAYDKLLNQFLPVKISLSNYNIDRYLPKTLEAVRIYGKPRESLNVPFTRTGGGIVSETSLYSGGEIYPVDRPVSQSPIEGDAYYFSLSGNKLFREYCDVSDRIESIYITFTAQNAVTNFSISDGVQQFNLTGSFGIAQINLMDVVLDKRNITIRSLDRDDTAFGFKKVFVTFSTCSEIQRGVVREIKYDMDANYIFKIEYIIANVNMVLSGYLWKNEKKLENLEKILSLQGV